MKESKYTEKLTGLLDKYELKDVISDDDQQYMLKNKLFAFNSIMKSVKSFGILAAIFSALYFFFKKHTLLAILLQKVAIILIASSLIGGTSYIVYNQFIKKYLNKPDAGTEVQLPADKQVNNSENLNDKNTDNLEKESSIAPVKNDIAKEEASPKPIDYDKIKYNIRIKTFKSTALEKNELSKMSEKFRMQLQKNQNEKYAIISNVINSSNCDHVVSFSIEEYDGEFVVNVKMIDINTSKIEMLSEYTSDSPAEFDKLWPQISKDVRSKID